MDMPRKYIANIAVMFGIRPGRMGKKKLTKAIFQKMERMEEQSRREAMKPTPEIIKRLGEPYGAPCDNESCPAYDGLTGQCEINCNCHLAKEKGEY